MNKIELKINGKNLIADLAVYNNKQCVAITPICDAIGIAANMQRKKLQNNPQFTAYVNISPSTGGHQDTLMLPVEEVGMWLCNINARRVKEEVRDVLIAFQKHCQVELHAAITGTAGTARVAALEDQVSRLTNLVTRLVEENQVLTSTVNSLWRAKGYEGKAASYSMHAAKARKNSVNTS